MEFQGQAEPQLLTQEMIANSPAGWYTVILGQLFSIAIFVLSIISIVEFYKVPDSKAFQWVIVIAVLYGLGYLSIVLSICTTQPLDKLRYTAPITAITTIPISCWVTNKLHQSIGGTRFFFNIVPSFALGIYTFTQTNNTIYQNGVYLALLVMTSISMAILGLILVLVCGTCCCAICIGAAAS